MTISLTQGALAGASGGLVGFVLALLGGGGSILATPLLLFVVGVPNPHAAIGTSAVAVSVNALASLATHAGARTVKWRCAGLFAATGVVGALIGSTIGKAMDGQKLMAIFAVLMIVIGLLSLRRKGFEGDAGVRLSRANAPLLVAFGFSAGLVSGFFGIGGGFLIAPGLIAATGMPMIYAVGSSLVSVAAFGAATAFNYALSGDVDWPLALAFVAGGAMGALGGSRAGRSLSGKKGALDVIFACAIILTGSWMLYQSLRFVF
ncbi:MAG: sulfite exporter TauE/SafE family protein [Beijerinckiaceae bacterium]|nr:sulfite exporter TauE/SafE family protein [Beijerinckiaceae bacterium]